MQVSNDRYGRKNTIARFLLRIALSSDMLEERPNSWPRPPGGFSSTRVLGPQSDLIPSSPQKASSDGTHPNATKSRKKRKKKRDRDAKAESDEDNNIGNSTNVSGEHPLLSRALSSGRGGGFSIEELELDRAQKRAKTSVGVSETSKCT